MKMAIKHFLNKHEGLANELIESTNQTTTTAKDKEEKNKKE